jgi:GT2 family glycosyltransferase
MTRPLLAIVIVTHNRWGTLQRTLERLHALEAAYPIVVVDNASTDGTVAEIREKFPRVKVIPLGQNLGAIARNYGVHQVQQPYIAFADDDSWWARGTLAQAIQIFEEYPRLGLMMARIKAGPEERLDPCCELMQRSPLPRPADLPGIPILGFVGCGALVRRAAFLQVNGFHKRFGSGGEEALLAIDLARHGWGLIYLDTLVAHHHPSRQRDTHRRQIEGTRNWLWTAWLRRSHRHNLRLTRMLLRAALTDPTTRRALVPAFLGLPWIIRERVAMPRELERQIELLEEQMGVFAD